MNEKPKTPENTREEVRFIRDASIEALERLDPHLDDIVARADATNMRALIEIVRDIRSVLRRHHDLRSRVDYRKTERNSFLLEALKEAGHFGLSVWRLDELIPETRSKSKGRGFDHVRVRICQMRRAYDVKIKHVRSIDVANGRYILIPPSNTDAAS